MSTARLNLTIEYEDGETCEVIADQRDMVGYEAEAGEGFLSGLSQHTLTAVRHVAYLVLKRKGLLPDPKMTRDQWSDTVPFVDFDMVNADPGKPEAQEPSSSGSPSRRTRASGKSSSSGSPRT